MGLIPGINGFLSVPHPIGQALFEASSTSWVVPENVIEISAVCIGRGSSSGGSLRWASSILVTPGETLTISVSTSGGGQARIQRGATTLLSAAGGSSGTSSTIGGNIGGALNWVVSCIQGRRLQSAMADVSAL